MFMISASVEGISLKTQLIFNLSESLHALSTVVKGDSDAVFELHSEPEFLHF